MKPEYAASGAFVAGLVAVADGFTRSALGIDEEIRIHLGATVAVMGAVAFVMLLLGRSAVLLAVASALVVAIDFASVHPVIAILRAGEFADVYPADVELLTLFFACWGVGMAFALGLASRRRAQWTAVALASVATVPLLGALLQVSRYRRPGVAPSSLYRVAFVVGIGLWTAIVLFHLGSTVRRETSERSRAALPIGIAAGVACTLQVLVLTIAGTLHLPPIQNVGGAVIGVVTVGPVLYVVGRMGYVWHRSAGT